MLRCDNNQEAAGHGMGLCVMPVTVRDAYLHNISFSLNIGSGAILVILRLNSFHRWTSFNGAQSKTLYRVCETWQIFSVQGSLEFKTNLIYDG